MFTAPSANISSTSFVTQTEAMSMTATAYLDRERATTSSEVRDNRARWTVALALIAGMLIFGGTQWVTHARRDVGDTSLPVTDYSALFHDRRGLPNGLSLAPSPAGSRWKLSDEPRAIRIGARLADLELVSRARDAAAHASYYAHDPVADWTVAKNSDLIDRFAGDLATAFDAVPGGRAAAAWYRIAQQRGRDQATSDWNAMRYSRAWALDFHPGLISLGEWLETARAAALRQDGAYFATPQSRAMASAAAKLPALPETTRVLLERVNGLTSAAQIADFHAVERALTDALTALTK
jgi:hypothetical protein